MCSALTPMRMSGVGALIAALVAGSLLAGVPGANAQDVGAADAPSPEASSLKGIDLDTVTIPELQAHRDEGVLTSSALTRAYLRRIETVDPKINAVLYTDPSALRQAAASDARHRSGRAARTARRHPGAAQGQRRHPRPADHGRVARTGRLYRPVTTPCW